MTSTDTAVFRIYIKAPIDKVWAYIVDPEFNGRYAYGTPSHYDLRPGGGFETPSTPQMIERGAPPVMCDGEVIEVDAPHRLVQKLDGLLHAGVDRGGLTHGDVGARRGGRSDPGDPDSRRHQCSNDAAVRHRLGRRRHGRRRRWMALHPQRPQVGAGDRQELRRLRFDAWTSSSSRSTCLTISMGMWSLTSAGSWAVLRDTASTSQATSRERCSSASTPSWQPAAGRRTGGTHCLIPLISKPQHDDGESTPATRWWPTTTTAASPLREHGGCSVGVASTSVRLLDGGLAAWVAAGGALDTDDVRAGARRCRALERSSADDRHRWRCDRAKGCFSTRGPASGTEVRWSRSTRGRGTYRARSVRRRRTTSMPLVASARSPSCDSGSRRSACETAFRSLPTADQG